MIERLRGIRPPNGRGYELFDCSFLLLVLMYVGYVITTPSPTQMRVLSGVFEVVPQQTLGAVGAIAALYGLYAAYFPKLINSAYVVTAGTALLWSGLFLVAFLERLPEIAMELGRPLAIGAAAFALLVGLAIWFPEVRKQVGVLLAILMLVVIVDSAASYMPSDSTLESLRVLINATLYGWVGRRLWREEDRDYGEGDEEI